ncbi:MAG: NAD-dependent deacylase [Planctomycetota bacterium]|nr:NAD-dependent deacylase [Planctomycetota bacterium]
MPSDTTDEQLSLVASRLRSAASVVVLTGAGVSAESGLRTFRGATSADLPPDMRTLWAEFDPAKLATPEAFQADPAMVTKWYDWRRLGCLAAEPNPGHLALAAMEHALRRRGVDFTLLTQNVDRLHQRAGSSNVVELHGSIIQWRCTETGTTLTPPPEPMQRFPPPSPFAPGALLRPDVVWFGETLPELAIATAVDALQRCDLFMSIGTSAVVHPAAGFIEIAAAVGAFLAEINAEATPVSRRVDVSVRGSSANILPKIVQASQP